MKKYTIKAVRIKNALMLQVRHSGKIVCNLHLHAYYAPIFCSTKYIIQAWTDSAIDFKASLSSKMQKMIQSLLDREEVWNEGFTICTK